MVTRSKDKHGRAIKRRNLDLPLALDKEITAESKRLGWSWAQTARDMLAECVALRRAREVAK